MINFITSWFYFYYDRLKKPNKQFFVKMMEFSVISTYWMKILIKKKILEKAIKSYIKVLELIAFTCRYFFSVSKLIFWIFLNLESKKSLSAKELLVLAWLNFEIQISTIFWNNLKSATKIVYWVPRNIEISQKILLKNLQINGKQLVFGFIYTN